MAKLLLVLKCCILFAAMCNATLEVPDHLKPQAELLHNTCKEETNVDEDLIFQSRGGYLPPNRELQCYIHCLFFKTELIDENGVLHLEDILHLLPTEIKEVIDAVLVKCQTVHGKDHCETAWLTVKCYFEADPEHSMLI